MVGFALLRTRIGRATRAVSDNPALASASGIDTDKVIRLVWTVAMGLAGLSGLLYALVVNGIKWDSGLQILLLLFAAVTLGGLGTAFGALIGALIIGLVVELSPVLGMPGDFKYATALLILILLLLVRPQGLLGKAAASRLGEGPDGRDPAILNGMMSSATAPQTAAVAIAVIGLNIHFGFTGLLNIGQSAFMLLGAYGFAIRQGGHRPADRPARHGAGLRPDQRLAGLPVRADPRCPTAEAAR